MLRSMEIVRAKKFLCVRSRQLARNRRFVSHERCTQTVTRLFRFWRAWKFIVVDRFPLLGEISSLSVSMVTSRHNQRQTKEHGKILTADKKLRDKTATSIVVFHHAWLTKLYGETFESVFEEKCSKIYGTVIYLLSRSKAQWNIELLSAALPWKLAWID